MFIIEKLLVCAILLYEEIITKEYYWKVLDEVFLQNYNNEMLLYLECEKNIKEAIIYIRTHVDYLTLDYEIFGKFLMEELNKYYNQISDIHKFANRMYSLWESIPEIIQNDEPFFILSYADDPLSWGDEKQSIDIYESMLNYYK